MSKHHEMPFGHCLGCVPVRTGVLAFSCFLLFLSFFAVAGLVTEDTRILVGGYAPCSNWLVDVLGTLGVVFSLMCLVGVTDNHSRWVRWFAHFAAVRTIVRLFILWADWSILSSCEKFGVSSVTSHYNAAMEMVVLQGRCSSARTYYLIISILDILISTYGVWNTYHWCYVMDTSPMYHISIDDTKPLRIYTGYSTVGHPEAPPIVTVLPPMSPGPDVSNLDAEQQKPYNVRPGGSFTAAAPPGMVVTRPLGSFTAAPPNVLQRSGSFAAGPAMVVQQQGGSFTAQPGGSYTAAPMVMMQQQGGGVYPGRGGSVVMAPGYGATQPGYSTAFPY